MAKNRDESAGSNSSTGSEILGPHAKNQTNKNVASSAIEFGARAFDLCSALVNASQPTSAIVRSTQDLLKWLARERVDEYSFTKCAEKARSLAYPNANGVAIRNQIEDADKRLHAVRGAPIGLIVSGSLGRLMARDADYCYIVSTVTVLAPYYGHQRLTDVLTSMMLDKGSRHVDGVFYKYEVQREPIRAVVVKIIESVFLNVVNSGHKLGGLPPELQDYHPHIVDHLTFAGIIMGVQESDADVLMKSQHFLADIVAWLLHHFEGHIEVSVGTKIVYEKALGSGTRMVRVMFDGVCPYPENCYEREGTIEVSYAMGDGTFATFLKSGDDCTSEGKPQSHERKAFYFEGWTSEPFPLPRRSTGLNKSERNYALAVGKNLMKWLLNVPIEAGPSSSFGLTFKAKLHSQEGNLRVRDIIQAYPGLLQITTGLPEYSGPVFRGFVAPESDDELDTSHYKSGDVMNPDEIVDCFPAMQDLLNDAQKRCSCPVCSEYRPLLESKRGCLRGLIWAELLLIVAHAIADSLGAKDVSALAEPSNIVAAMYVLLSNLIRKECIVWDDWFAIAIVTSVGMGIDTIGASQNNKTRAGNGATSLVAAQMGSFIAVAPWLDLNREISVKGCFGLEFYEGNMQRVAEDVALLRSEASVESSGTGNRQESSVSELDDP